MILGLCKGRHALPLDVEGYIFEESVVDPTDVANLDRIAKAALAGCAGEALVLYVTGLTPALVAALNAARAIGVRSVVLKHFNRENGGYFNQAII